MIVLSLFDGIACGLEALKRAGIEVTQYFASEIEPNAIKIAMKNHPEIIQLGDVLEWRSWDLPKVDLIIGGSPCQGFANCGSKEGFDDPRSQLFWEMIDIIEEYNPKFKMLENVVMKREWRDMISKAMGCEPVRINSKLVSAQLRNRDYWCNFKISAPEDRGLSFHDIIESGWVDRDKSLCIDATYWKGCAKSHYFKKSLRQLVFMEDTMEGKHRMLSVSECEKLQTLPVGYTDVDIYKKYKYQALGNGWTVEVISHIFSQMQKQEEDYEWL